MPISTASPALLTVALARGVIDLDPILARISGGPAGYHLATVLAPHLDDVGLARLTAALGERGHLAAPAWISRGQLTRALEAGFTIGLADELLANDDPLTAERAAWLARARAHLDALPADDVLGRLAAAKVVARHTPLDDAWLAGLRAAFDADVASGAYDELDYAYGTVDPTLELARVYAGRGRLDEVDALLDGRARRLAAFLNDEEITEVSRLLAVVGGDARAAMHARFLTWARQTDPKAEHREIYVAHLLTRAPTPAGFDPTAELTRVIDAATHAHAIGVIATADVAPPLRARAIARLIDNARRDVDTLVEVSRAGAVKDWGRHATAVRQLGAATHALARLDPALRAPHQTALDAVTAAWAAWIVTQDISFDAWPHLTTAVGFAQLARAAIEPARGHVLAVTRRESPGVPMLTECDGWPSLFDDAQLSEVIATALA